MTKDYQHIRKFDPAEDCFLQSFHPLFFNVPCALDVWITL